MDRSTLSDRRLLSVLAGLASLLLPARLAAAPTSFEAELATAERLKRLSIEELFELEVVSASKRKQYLADVPAAISIVTSEDIRRSGVRNLPDALRLATGLHVARFDSRSWAISARGLNSTVGNKMLVLIDGRSVYTPLFSGVFWDAQAPLLEDIDRIEVIRGPGATLWGANAVNGVINVITKRAAETQGGLLLAGGGNEEGPFGALRWGGETTSGHYRIYGKIDRYDALVRADGRSADDALRRAQGGFRWDTDLTTTTDLSLSGDAYRGRVGHLELADSDVDGGHLLGRFRRRLSGGSELEVRGFYDYTSRRVPGQFEESRDTWDLELQHHLVRGRHEIVWGAGYRRSDDRTVAQPIFAFEPAAASSWVANLFLQDEVSLGDGWRVIAGAKVEDYSTADAEVLPSLRLAWEPSEHLMAWAGAARAIRAPTRIDRDVRGFVGGILFLAGNPDFAPEEALAYEAGLRFHPDDRWFAALVAFRHDYDDLRSQEPSPTFLPITFGNLLEASTEGIELELGWDPHGRASVRGGFTWLDTELRFHPESGDPTGGSNEANDPPHHWFLRCDLDLPRDLDLGLWLRHVGALPRPEVPSYTELDVRLAWDPRPGVTLALVGQSLLDSQHGEFGAEGNRDEVERGVYGQVTWTF